MFEGKGKPLSEEGVKEAGNRLGVGLPALWAVMTVETKGCGFLPDRRPLILFERHWFRKLTDGKYDAVVPDLSNPTWGGYGAAGGYQHERLARAVKLDRKAALESTSWGLGQVMGFNAKAVGFGDAEAMVAAMCDSEDAQFQGMVGFIATQGLAPSLKIGDWVEFARRYNGSEFQKNKYDQKLAIAHEKFKVGPLPSLRARTTQLYLSYLGYNTGGVDGLFGDKSQKALIAFQRSAGLTPTGGLDDATSAALEKAAMAD
jgi:hypothetical protein